MKRVIENIFDGVVPLVGRVLLSLIFLTAGWGKISGWDGTSGYMASAGIPLVPIFLAGAIAVEILGGLSLLTGIGARWGAAALFLFLIPTTFLFHAFWNLEGQQQQIQSLMFMKNLAIMGGLAMVAAYGSGRFSIDRIPCPFKARKAPPA